MRSIVAVTCLSQLNGIIKIDAVDAEGRGICKFYPSSYEPAELNEYIREMMFSEDPFIPNLQNGKVIIPAGTQLPQNFNQNVGQMVPVQMQAQPVQQPVMQTPANQPSQSTPTAQQEPAKRGPGRPKAQPQQAQQQQVSPAPTQPATIQQQPMLTQQPHPVQQQAQAPIQQVPQQMPVQQVAPVQPKPTGTKALPDPEASHCIKGWINEAMQGQPIPAYLTACLEQMKQILSTGNEGKPYPIIIDGEENADMKAWVIDSIRTQLAQAAQNPQQLI